MTPATNRCSSSRSGNSSSRDRSSSVNRRPMSLTDRTRPRDEPPSRSTLPPFFSIAATANSAGSPGQTPLSLKTRIVTKQRTIIVAAAKLIRRRDMMIPRKRAVPETIEPPSASSSYSGHRPRILRDRSPPRQSFGQLSADPLRAIFGGRPYRLNRRASRAKEDDPRYQLGPNRGRLHCLSQ